ncbi:MAG: hypothetical protein ACLFNT_15185 [Spirochaetales bacterium]
MRTTLNLPDELAREAKLRAVEENTTLTRLIVEGLEYRVRSPRSSGPLPVSRASGGVREGVNRASQQRSDTMPISSQPAPDSPAFPAYAFALFNSV